MLIFWAVLGGFLLDALFGDPAWLPHPVVLMGRCISALEKRLRTALPKTPRGELAGGAVVAAVLPLGTLAVTGLACWGAARLHPALGLALQMLWCGQALAAKGLAQESRNVYKELAKGDLPAARRAVARIVGRDTQNLTAAGVTRAAVETVAENASDGVIAPLLYMLLGGAPLALTYKAINTMDSMLGYKNEKYLYFGRCAAKLDDAANWLPSRLAALLWVAAAALTGNSRAQVNLGVMYANGEGFPVDLEEACFWFELSKLCGNEDAQQGLDFVAPQLDEAAKDRARRRAQRTFKRMRRQRDEQP